MAIRVDVNRREFGFLNHLFDPSQILTLNNDCEAGENQAYELVWRGNDIYEAAVISPCSRRMLSTWINAI